MKSLRFLLSTAVAATMVAVSFQTAHVSAASAQAAAAATDGPGALSHFDLARKDCVGTARNTTSKVWFTIAGGLLSDVYSPTVDNTNVETLQYVVTDGSTFTDLQARDMTYAVRATDRSGMACQVTSTARSGKYRLVTDYITDPARDSVVMRTRLQRLQPGPGALQVYVRYDATINGNGGGGAANGGADSATVDPPTTALVSYDTSIRSQAVNRDYAVPLYGALLADRPFLAEESGFAGQASDGLTQLDASHRLTAASGDALNGNVVQTAQADISHDSRFTLALGFGQTQSAAVRTAAASVAAPFERTYERYVKTWREYDDTLRAPPENLPGGLGGDQLANRFYLAANAVKASEDKTFLGAIVAGLASPWGQAVSAGDAPGGLPVYFGSYREVFSRDLYEAFTGLLTDGDMATARTATRFLLERQQLPSGELPRNSLVNGKAAPDTGGDQLDESSYPILMALQSGLDHDGALYRDHIKKAADFVVARGPSFGTERWEEQSGFSPSTIAAEIAGLVAAGTIADQNGDHASARVYRATADHFQRSIKGWTVTTTGGPNASGHYFIRVSKDGDPNAAISYNLGNGSITADQRSVVDAGFLELTRLGELPAADPDVQASLGVVDSTLARQTSSGRGFYRYGTSAPGSEDGYGDCWVVPDSTNCSPDGKPWPTGNVGSGHLWPVLSNERAEQDLQTGDRQGAASQLRAMFGFAGGVGLEPEQDWEDANLAASSYGSDPTVASIGFVNGKPAGSANPLTWAEGVTVRLIQDLGQGRLLEQPAVVRDRYKQAPAAAPVTITAPANGTVLDAGTTTVTGTTAPGATVDIATTPVDTGGATATIETIAAGDGSFSGSVPTPFGADVITVAATTAAGATGYAQVSVVSDFVSGTTLLDVIDPTGDDNGPGTYAYPTASDFHPGAFDMQHFQVIDSGSDIFLRVQTGDLSPTFGSALGAQLLDIFVRDPSKTVTSSAPPFPSRNYSMASGSAWSSRIEVQGFAGPVFVDAAGNSLGSVAVSASAVSRFITVIVPKSALGQPGHGWIFSVVLTGQDGFSQDQARGFAATPQSFQFGVCAPGGTSPICSVNPATVPKAIDVLTPAGVNQTTELDPTRGPVAIQGVAIP